jgi:hypothetical protein
MNTRPAVNDRAEPFAIDRMQLSPVLQRRVRGILPSFMAGQSVCVQYLRESL